MSVCNCAETGSPFKVCSKKLNTTMFTMLDFTDGRAVPEDPNPTWLGYSVGKWDGDVLQVDTAGFNGKTWLDFDGHPTTERLHVVERFERHDFGHMSIQVVIDDPGAYTKPWQTIEQFELLPDTTFWNSSVTKTRKVPRTTSVTDHRGACRETTAHTVCVRRLLAER